MPPNNATRDKVRERDLRTLIWEKGGPLIIIERGPMKENWEEIYRNRETQNSKVKFMIFIKKCLLKIHNFYKKNIII